MTMWFPRLVPILDLYILAKYALLFLLFDPNIILLNYY